MKIYKKILAVLLCIVMVLGSTVIEKRQGRCWYECPTSGAKVYVSGDYQYAFMKEKETITIKGYLGKEKNIITPKTIDGYKVECICGYVYKASGIESVVISEGVKVIEDYALASDTIKRVHIPKSVHTLAKGVFAGCKSLRKVTGGEHIRNVESSVFARCKLLKKIPTFPKIHEWGQYGFAGSGITEVRMPMKKVDVGTFENCKKLRKVVLTGKKTDDYWGGRGAFENCTNLNTVKMQGRISGIASSFFKNCKRLKRVTFPGKLKEIDNKAFQNCKNLKKISIPKSVSFIAKDAFKGCKKLTIYCKKGSYAHKYAKKNHKKYRLIK